ncbi:MAG: MerR family transcriptional regulator [Alphaproteobacteria bacterium]|nr:MAG: MerR family transcriptional regulator [Alphaproteobacteria bacterium]
MQYWYVKELSKLSGITIRTLQYYDKINLLKPSKRLSNNYRVYSETDLAKLQQILALKFLGFNLTQIKLFLSGDEALLALLKIHNDFLSEKIKQLKEAKNILAAVIQESPDQIDTQSILKLIGVYKTMKDLENSWADKIFTKEQLKKFAEMQKPNEKESEQYGKDWETLIAEVVDRIHEDPYGKIGQTYAKKWMDLVGVYWKDRELGEAIWEAYKQNKVPKHMEGLIHIPQAVVHWIDKAVYFMSSGKKK